MGAYLRRAYDLLLLTRPLNAVQPLLLVVVGAAVSGAHLSDSRLSIGLAVVLLLHGAVTLWNDIEDVAIDRRNHVSTVLTEGFVSGRIVWGLVLAQLIAAAVLMIFLPPVAVLAATLFFALGWQYNAQPWRASRRPIASLAVLALTYGFLPLLMGASLGHLDGEIISLGIVWSVSRVSLSLLKDYKDAVGDAKSNKQTFLLVFGHSRVRLASIVGVVVGNAGILLLAMYLAGQQAGAAVLVAAICLYTMTVAWRTRLFLRQSYYELNEVFHQCLYLQILFDGAVALWLMTSFSS